MTGTRIVSLEMGIARAYVIGNPGNLVLVDSGYSGMTLIRVLKKVGVDPRELRLAIVTHAHGDHFGGLEALSDPRPYIACGKDDAEAMAEGRNSILPPFGPRGRLFSLALGRTERRAPAYPKIPTDLIFSGGESLAAYGIEAEIVAVPGHTPGSIAVMIPEALIPGGPSRPAAIVGDLVMGGFVFHRWPGLPLFASGFDELRSSLALLKKRGAQILFTGHGGPLEASKVWKRFGL